MLAAVVQNILQLKTYPITTKLHQFSESEWDLKFS